MKVYPGVLSRLGSFLCVVSRKKRDCISLTSILELNINCLYIRLIGLKVLPSFNALIMR